MRKGRFVLFIFKDLANSLLALRSEGFGFLSGGCSRQQGLVAEYRTMERNDRSVLLEY